MDSVVLIFHGIDCEQDVRPLVKAFFPDTGLVIVHGGGEERQEGLSILFDFFESSFSMCIEDTGEHVSEQVGIEDIVKGRGYTKECRNRILRALYRLLSEYTGRKLPWGILTGVRPAKLIREKLEESPQTDIQAYMAENYYCSPKKSSLGMEVAKREMSLLENVNCEREYSIYIGVPFCPSICNYCSFGSTPLNRNVELVEPYIAALKKEISAAAQFFPGLGITSVYMGGGTPTTLEANQLEEVILHTRREFGIENDGKLEFSVEAGRPDSINRDKLNVLKQLCVNRISINPQSMVDRTLEVIGRNHTAQETERAFMLARECGHDNINMDLIIGLSGETVQDVEYTLGRIERLDPESLTVHTLALKRAAQLTTQKERFSGFKAVGVQEMQSLTMDYAAEHGYHPYYMYRQKNMAENLENIGYAKNRRECLYNVLIMEEKQIILALGAGASSKFVFQSEDRFERVENVKSVKDYIERIDEMIGRKRRFIESHNFH